VQSRPRTVLTYTSEKFLYPDSSHHSLDNPNYRVPDIDLNRRPLPLCAESKPAAGRPRCSKSGWRVLRILN
jgi:hypothetical protein